MLSLEVSAPDPLDPSSSYRSDTLRVHMLRFPRQREERRDESVKLADLPEIAQQQRKRSRFILARVPSFFLIHHIF